MILYQHTSTESTTSVLMLSLRSQPAAFVDLWRDSRLGFWLLMMWLPLIGWGIFLSALVLVIISFFLPDSFQDKLWSLKED